MNKSRTKLFMENFFVYGLGSILSKIAPIIVLPIVTRLMPNTVYYGLNDLSNIAVSFGSAIALMGMYDAMFRMFFENDDFQYKKEICSSALSFVCASGVLICCILYVFKNIFSIIIFKNINYVNLLNLTSISILISTLSSIVIAPTRMQNKRKIFLVTNTLSPILGYSISIPMLVYKNYLYALPCAALISSTLMFVVFYILNIRWFSFSSTKWSHIKDMLKIGAPLMPGFVIYWLFTSCSRIMISRQMGTEFVGIYGVGARVASISQFIYLSFAGGWQYFAFSTMKDDDQVELTSKIFEYLALVAYSAFLIIVPFTYFIFKTFFAGNYIKGYIVFPYLFLSPLILMLYQTIVNQFLVVKKTWPSTLILFIGAVVNIILNYILINIIGIEGSAISTLIGYTVSVTIAGIVLSRMKLIVVSRKMITMSIVMAVFMIIRRLIPLKYTLLMFSLSVAIIIMFLYLYRREVAYIYNKGKNLLNHKSRMERA